jgi:hypothetical protein
MSAKSAILVALLGGAVITGTGFVLIAAGGWGPCGPAGLVTQIGGFLSVDHLLFYSKFFSSLSTVSIFGVFAIAALDWAVAILILLTLYKIVVLGVTARRSS